MRVLSLLFLSVFIGIGITANENYNSEICKQFRFTYTDKKKCRKAYEKEYSSAGLKRCLGMCYTCMKSDKDQKKEFIDLWMR